MQLLDGPEFKADRCQIVCTCSVGNWNLWSQFFVGMIRFLLGPSWCVETESLFPSLLSCFFYVSGLDHFRAGQNLKQIFKGILQMSFKHWQAWAINHLTRKTVQGLATFSVFTNGKSVPPLNHPHAPFVLLCPGKSSEEEL